MDIVDQKTSRNETPKADLFEFSSFGSSLWEKIVLFVKPDGDDTEQENPKNDCGDQFDSCLGDDPTTCTSGIVSDVSQKSSIYLLSPDEDWNRSVSLGNDTLDGIMTDWDDDGEQTGSQSDIRSSVPIEAEDSDLFFRYDISREFLNAYHGLTSTFSPMNLESESGTQVGESVSSEASSAWEVMTQSSEISEATDTSRYISVPIVTTSKLVRKWDDMPNNENNAALFNGK